MELRAIKMSVVILWDPRTATDIVRYFWAYKIVYIWFWWIILQIRSKKVNFQIIEYVGSKVLK